MKKTIYTCDVDGCVNDKDIIVDKKMEMIFTTEQTEGRSTEPYITNSNLDICHSCLGEVIRSGKYIQASGAMGHNTYNVWNENKVYKKD